MKSSIYIRSLNQKSEKFSSIMFLEKFLVLSLHNLNVQIFSFSFNNGLSCSKDFLINKEFISCSFVKIVCHIKCFSSWTCFVKQRSVTDLQSSKFLNYSLIVEKRFESALRYFSLIRSIWGIPKISNFFTS